MHGSVNEFEYGIEIRTATPRHCGGCSAVVGIIPLHDCVTFNDVDIGTGAVYRVDLREESVEFGIIDGAGGIHGHQQPGDPTDAESGPGAKSSALSFDGILQISPGA